MCVRREGSIDRRLPGEGGVVKYPLAMAQQHLRKLRRNLLNSGNSGETSSTADAPAKPPPQRRALGRNLFNGGRSAQRRRPPPRRKFLLNDGVVQQRQGPQRAAALRPLGGRAAALATTTLSLTPIGVPLRNSDRRAVRCARSPVKEAQIRGCHPPVTRRVALPGDPPRVVRRKREPWELMFHLARIEECVVQAAMDSAKAQPQ